MITKSIIQLNKLYNFIVNNDNLIFNDCTFIFLKATFKNIKLKLMSKFYDVKKYPPKKSPLKF